jgi:hypothetical protein
MSFGMIRNELPINGDGAPSIKVGKDWFRFFANVFNACVLGSTDPLITFSGASPLIYEPSKRGQAIVSGGTVSAVELSRDGTTYYDTGQTAGVFPMSAADSIRITYTGTPTVLAYMPL